MEELKWSEADETRATVIARPFRPGWKLMQIFQPARPKGFKEWVRFLWGFDIFVGPVPFLKMIVGANAVVWLLAYVR